jgi:hypothetical protein
MRRIWRMLGQLQTRRPDHRRTKPSITQRTDFMFGVRRERLDAADPQSAVVEGQLLVFTVCSCRWQLP